MTLISAARRRRGGYDPPELQGDKRRAQNMRPYRRIPMKKTIFICILAALLSLPSCAPAGEEARLTVVCTTYPIYLFASSMAEGVEGVEGERLDTGSTSPDSGQKEGE